MEGVDPDDHGRLERYRDGPQRASKLAIYLQQDLLGDRADFLLVHDCASVDHLLK